VLVIDLQPHLFSKKNFSKVFHIHCTDHTDRWSAHWTCNCLIVLVLRLT